MTRPGFFASRSLRTNAWVRKNAPLRLRSMVASQTASVVSSTGTVRRSRLPVVLVGFHLLGAALVWVGILAVRWALRSRCSTSAPTNISPASSC